MYALSLITEKLQRILIPKNELAKSSFSFLPAAAYPNAHAQSGSLWIMEAHWHTAAHVHTSVLQEGGTPPSCHGLRAEPQPDPRLSAVLARD